MLEVTMMRGMYYELAVRTTMCNHSRLAGCAMLIVFFPLTAISPQSLSSNACVAKLPASEFVRVPVLVDTNPENMEAIRILPAADLLTQTVAEKIRKTLGSETGTLPSADSAVKWSELGGSVVVVAHRDGTYTWKEDTTALVGFMGTSELHRIADALNESSAAGDRIFWPDSVKEDSAAFRLAYAFPVMGADKKLQPLQVRVANPAFTIMMPWFKPAQMSHPPPVHFPTPIPNSSHYGIMLDFVVDSKGRVVPATIREYVPPGRDSTQGNAEYHRAFLKSVVRDFQSARFTPASIGGCAIDQRVRNPFDVMGLSIRH